MENDKWKIMKTDDKMLIWTNVIFLKFDIFDIFFSENPTGPSYVDI